MKVIILYRPNSEHAREVETFVQDYHDRYADSHLDLIDVDSREGTAMASLYEVMQYPALLALSNDGSVLRSWEGGMMPLMDEVAYYTYS